KPPRRCVRSPARSPSRCLRAVSSAPACWRGPCWLARRAIRWARAFTVQAGSAACAVAESFHLTGSLELPANRAIGFYAIVSAATLAGAGLTLTRIDPISMLFWTAVINGVVSVPIMLAMMIVVAKRKSRGGLALPLWLKILGWLATLLMAGTVGLLVWSQFA